LSRFQNSFVAPAAAAAAAAATAWRRRGSADSAGRGNDRGARWTQRLRSAGSAAALSATSSRDFVGGASFGRALAATLRLLGDLEDGRRVLGATVTNVLLEPVQRLYARRNVSRSHFHALGLRVGRHRPAQGPSTP